MTTISTAELSQIRDIAMRALVTFRPIRERICADTSFPMSTVSEASHTLGQLEFVVDRLAKVLPNVPVEITE